MDNCVVKTIKIVNVEETKVSKVKTRDTNVEVVNACVNVTSGGATDYSVLTGKPEINGVTLKSGNNTSAELNIIEDKHFVHIQNVPSSVWQIQHNLNKYPSVTIVDSAESIVIGDVEYIDINNIIVSFSSGFSGMAYLN